MVNWIRINWLPNLIHWCSIGKPLAIRWRLVAGNWWLEIGCWSLMAGGSGLRLPGWWLETGGWRLVAGGSGARAWLAGGLGLGLLATSLRPSWAILGQSWGHLKPILGHLVAILGHRGPFLAILGPSSAILGFLGAKMQSKNENIDFPMVLMVLKATLGRPYWSHLGANMSPRTKKCGPRNTTSTSGAWRAGVVASRSTSCCVCHTFAGPPGGCFQPSPAVSGRLQPSPAVSSLKAPSGSPLIIVN